MIRRPNKTNIILIKLLSLFKGVISFIAYYGGLCFLCSILPKKGFKAVILMYHDIDDVAGNMAGENISMKYFKKQVSYLKKHFTILTLGQLVDVIKDKNSKIKRAVVLTFDDGYISFKEKAYPFLKEENIKVTLFPAKTFLENKQGYLDENDLKGFSNLVEVGAHTINHYFFENIDSKLAIEEIVNSRKYLQETLSRDIDLFCYPRGIYKDIKPDIEESIKKQGFKATCISQEGVVTRNSNLFRLPRFSPRSFSISRFVTRLCFLLR